MYMQSEAQWKSGKSRKAIQGQASKDSVSKMRNAVPVIGGVFPSYKLKESLFGNGAVIQRVKFSDTTWAPEGEEGENAPFNEDQQAMIYNGLDKACTQLGNAMGFLDSQLGMEKVSHRLGLQLLCDALCDMLDVLRDNDLTIFPFKDSTSYGQSMEKRREISINILNHKKVNDVAKTLLHESFHIIGGCHGVTEIGDSHCRDVALSLIKGKRTIRSMNADSVAQFVMEC